MEEESISSKISLKFLGHQKSKKDFSVFVEFMGDTPAMRLLDFLITGREYDCTLTDMATKAGMSWSTLHRIFPRFIKNNIIIQTREIGRAKLYKLNLANLLVKKLVDVYDTLLMQELKRASVKGKKEVLVMH